MGKMLGTSPHIRREIDGGTLWSSILNFAKQMTTNGIQCAIVSIGGIGCLLPVNADPTSLVEGSRLRAALPAQQIRDSSVAVIALVFPLVLDIVTEMINSLIIGRKDEKLLMQTKPLLNNVEKLLFLFGTVIVPMNACVLSNSPRWAYIYLCSQQCQFTFAGGAVCISFCRYNPEYWSVRKTYMILTLLISGTLMGSFTDNYILLPQPIRLLTFLEMLSYYLILGAALFFLYCSARWLKCSIPKFVKSLPLLAPKANPSTKYSKSDLDNKAQLLFPIMYVITTLVAAGCLVLMEALYKGAQNYDEKALFVHNLAFLAYLLFITYGSMRMMKYEVVQGLYALIESKKMYVRYISHELRTPLNSACLGLQLLGEGLMPGSESSNEDRAEIVQDVKSACRTAVEILDDLLCFDKLESGILEVHKHDVSVIPFICECVEMFTSQAKEAGVTMSMVPPTAALHGATMMPVLSTDTVVMDKFKMDQVLRNLISNALKFTPKGGSVSFSASFVPNPEKNTVKSPERIDIRADSLTDKDRDKDKVREKDRGRDRGKSRDKIEERDLDVVKNTLPLTQKSDSHLQKSKEFFSSFLRNPSLINSNNKIHSSDMDDLEMGLANSLRCPNTKGWGASSNPTHKDAQRESAKNHRDSDVTTTVDYDQRVTNNHSTNDLTESELLKTRTNSANFTLPNLNTSRMYYERAGQLIGGGAPLHSPRYGPKVYDIHDYDDDILTFSNQGGEQKKDTASGFEALSNKITSISNRINTSIKATVEKKPTADNQSNRSGPNNPSHINNISNSNDSEPTVIYGKLVIVVTDTGAGISDVNLRRLFKEIVQFTPEKLQAGGGSGLGLWITNSLVNLHNGSIRAYSEGEGKGSSFTVSIDMQRRCNPGASHDTHNLQDIPPLSKNASNMDTLLTLSCESKDVCQEVISSRCSAYTGYSGSEGTARLLGRSMMASPLSLSEKASTRSPGPGWYSSVGSIRGVSRKGSTSAESRPDSSAGDRGSSTSDFGPLIPDRGSPPDQEYDMLVVDDSSLNRKMLCRIFKSAGYICDEADDGLAAVERVKAKMSSAEGEKKVYDAVLMDFVMPNMDGPTATKIIRELGYLGPIFGVTGNALDSDVTHFLNHGADLILPKPFDFKRFKEVMRILKDERKEVMATDPINNKSVKS